MTNGRACWWTNLDYPERHKVQPLGYQYKGHELDYPKYDNYNAIDIGYETSSGGRRGDFFRTPYDYDGVMGIPSTAFGKICPEQFEIIGVACGNSWANYPDILKSLDFDPSVKYGGGLGTGVVNGKAAYSRIFVRNRQPNRNDWEVWQKEIDEGRKDGK